LGLKPYECHFCHKRFGRQIHLQLHLRTHTGERPYVCDICGRAFAQGGDMRRHRLTHTGERAYKCELCSFSSNKRKTLREHEAAAHGHQRQPPPVTTMPSNINMSAVGGTLVARQGPIVTTMVPTVTQVTQVTHMIVPTATQYVVQDPRMFLAAELHKNWSEN
jgi:DNA-directed RNA polymerase subunit RPC12/RpoP